MVTRVYNMIAANPSDSDARNGMLFTDNELKRMPWYERRDLLAHGAKLVRVEVNSKDTYYCFGARFATAIKKYIAEK